MFPSDPLLPLLVAGAAAVLVLVALLWLVILSIAASREIRKLKTGHRKSDAELGELKRAWQAAVGICENCGRILFTSDCSRAEAMSDGEVHYYCKECK